MRVLTVRQPWAWAIIHGGKDVENRVRNIAGSYRGPVAIHAGLAALEPGAILHPGLQTQPIGRGAFRFGEIVGVVDLLGVHSFAECDRYPIGMCSSWAEQDAWHLALANPRPLTTPVPFQGALGLRTLPADVEAVIREQVK